MLWQSATVTLMIIPTSVAVTEFLCTQPRDGVLATYEMQTLGWSQTTSVTIDPEFVRKLSSDQIGVKWGGVWKLVQPAPTPTPLFNVLIVEFCDPFLSSAQSPLEICYNTRACNISCPISDISSLPRDARLRERWRATYVCIQNAKFAMGRTMLLIHSCISIQRPSRACFEGFCEWGLL